MVKWFPFRINPAHLPESEFEKGLTIAQLETRKRQLQVRTQQDQREAVLLAFIVGMIVGALLLYVVIVVTT